MLLPPCNCKPPRKLASLFVRTNLLALRVVVVELDAGAAGLAGGGTAVANTAALTPLADGRAGWRRSLGGDWWGSLGGDWRRSLSSGRRRRATGATSGSDGRAGDLVVGDTLPDVDLDAGVVAIVGTREADAGRELSVAGAAGNVDLDAATVLRVRYLVCWFETERI